MQSSHPQRASEHDHGAARVAAILASDRTYFEMGAELHEVDGATLAVCPGFDAVPAACVVTQVDPEQVGDVAAWLGRLAERARAFGFRLLRMYLDENGSDRLGDPLRAAGLRARVEEAFLSPAHERAGEPTIELTPIGTPADWRAKQRIHERTEHQADGYEVPPAQWVAFERHKHERGALELFLASSGGAVVGAVGTIAQPPILRLKNIVIDPSHRRRGLGTAVVRALWAVGDARGFAGAGAFAVQGGPGGRLYRRAGLRPCAKIVEWHGSVEDIA